MKRILSLTLALLMTVLLLGAAGANTFTYAEDESASDNPYVGLWMIIAQKEGESTTLYADKGMKVYLDFQPSGLIYGLLVNENGAEEEYLAYAVTGENTLYIYEKDRPLSGVYDPATETITVTEEVSGIVTFIQRAHDEQMPDASALIDRSQEEQTYYVYQLTNEGETYDMLDFLPAMGEDIHNYFLILRPDGTGRIEFGSEENGGDITWTDSVLISVNNPDDPASFTREGKHLLLTIDDDIFAFAPKDEVEALLNLKKAQAEQIAEIPADQVKELTPENIAGLWTVTKIEYNGVTLSVSSLGMEVTMEFMPDGTVKAMSKMGDETDEATMTYEITGENTLTFQEGDSTNEATYDPATDTIILAQDDSGKMTLERATADKPAPAPEEPAVQPVAAEVSDLVGKWEFTKAIAMGFEVPAEQIGTTMILILNADGTATLDTNGSAQEINWALTEENTVSLTIGDYEVFALTYDGTFLTLTMSGVDMLFERTAE